MVKTEQINTEKNNKLDTINKKHPHKGKGATKTPVNPTIYYDEVTQKYRKKKPLEEDSYNSSINGSDTENYNDEIVTTLNLELNRIIKRKKVLHELKMNYFKQKDRSNIIT